MKISEFRGKYYFLSNFYPAPIVYRGIHYENNEAAFQSMKTLNPNTRRDFCLLDPSSAKRKGRYVILRKDWEEVKDTYMYEICLAKFTQNTRLKKLLLETEEAELIEGNDWNDQYWGVCRGIGENVLGKILMKIRSELREVCGKKD